MLMIASTATSLLIALIVTPLDMVAWQLKSRQMGFSDSPLKKSLSPKAILGDIRQVNGLGLLLTTAVMANFVRNFFILASSSLVFNSYKQVNSKRR
mmetsp:Transcript_8221/g.13760  ORF Transcript_8221/g.13760 Transcript_8221/m.13760 type:complete len:96 (+) Transcript_8221:1058-1345(+)